MSVQSVTCGGCGEAIRPDPLTGTTCACACAVSPDKFKADPPDSSPQHELVRKLWEAQLSDASEEHKRLMALAATELEGHLPATDDFVRSMRRKHAKVLR